MCQTHESRAVVCKFQKNVGLLRSIHKYWWRGWGKRKDRTDRRFFFFFALLFTQELRKKRIYMVPKSRVMWPHTRFFLLCFGKEGGGGGVEWEGRGVSVNVVKFVEVQTWKQE